MSVLFPTFLRGLPQDVLDDASRWFTPLEVDYGTLLVGEGEEDPCLFVVVEGQVAVQAGRVEVATIGANGVVGEVETFGEPLRIASVKAIAPSKLLVLDRDGYEGLRASGSEVAVRLEQEIVRQLVPRVQDAFGRVFALQVELDTGHLPTVSLVERVLAWLGFDWMSGRIDTVAPLRALPQFSWCTDDAIEALAADGRPRVFSSLQRIAKQGEATQRAYVILEGNVDRIRAEGDETRLISTDGPGSIVGFDTVLSAGVHQDTVQARGRVVALELRRAKLVDRWEGRDLVGAGLRTAMICALGDQLASANSQLAILDDARRRSIARTLSPLRERVLVTGG